MGQLGPGFYRINGSANLRFVQTSKGLYPAYGQLQAGDVVYPCQLPEGHEHDPSYFDGKEGERSIGSWRTEHTWVVVISQMDEKGRGPEGWIDNGRMDKLLNQVEQCFKVGDVLYGRKEARAPWRLRGLGSAISKYDHNIIDTLNMAIINGVIGDEEVDAFAEFLGEQQGCQPVEVRIRKMCKAGLTYITDERMHRVHFILDGLDPKRVVAESGVHTKLGAKQGRMVPRPTKYCTGAEMRTLMRQRMHDIGLRCGKDYDIFLDNVWFYLATERVDAPWESGAPAAWKDAWTKYKQLKMSLKPG